MSVLPIVLYPDPGLLTPTRPVDEQAAITTGQQSVVPTQTGAGASGVIVESVYQAGAIELPSPYEPWASEELPVGTQGTEDAGAFFWGSGDLDEAPPAPTASGQ